MGADLVTQGAPAAKQPGTEGIILDAKNNALYTFGNSGVPALVGTSGAAPAASPTFTGVVTQPAPSVLTAATTATTVGAAGGASALPATPTGYLSVSINGTVFKIPYYGV